MKNLYFLILSFFLCVSCNNNDISNKEIPQKPTLVSNTQQMIDSLDAIYQRTNFWMHPYASVEAVALIEKRLNQMQQENKMDWQLYIKLGLEYLNAGDTDKAIEIFERVKNQFPQFAELNDNSKQMYDGLAIAWLRKGEQENCIHNHSDESCVFPIQGKGIHTIRTGSEKAIELYKEILKVYPDDLQSRWLLNIAYMTLGEYPQGVPAPYLIPPEQIKADYDLPEFKNIAMNIGLDINNLSGGVVADDFNKDGFIDIMASSWGMRDQIRFFINNGDGTFTDQTESSGLKGITGGLNLRQADYNNDGHLDVLVLRGAWSGITALGIQPNSLLHNNGDGTFSDVTISAGLYSVHPTQTATWLDFDLDGDLDLFIGNETATPNEKHPCEFFLNNGNGNFTNIAATIGLNIVAYIKGVNSGDINNDNLPDLYISKLDGSNMLFVNRGGQNPKSWKFENIAQKARVELPTASFPVWFFDYNNDGLEDIFVASFDNYAFKNQAAEVIADYLNMPFKGEHPRLYKNLGNETFEDVTIQMRLNKAVHTMGCNYGDLDNDGFIDFYLGTGAPDFRAIVPNRVFRNDAGREFQDVTTSGRFGLIQKGHGVGFADFDNDGDQDIYSVIGGSVTGDVFQNAFYENPGNKYKWITIELIGNGEINTSAIGARIWLELEMEDGTKRNIYQTVTPGASFGGNSLQLEIGLEKAKTISSLSVNWPDKKNQYINYGSVKANQKFQLTSNSTEIKVIPIVKFEFDKSSKTHHHH